MNPLANAQLGQSTHREYEARYSQQFPKDKEGETQVTLPGWQKLALATGSIAAIIVLVSLVLTG